jgi:hypothetical protein
MELRDVYVSGKKIGQPRLIVYRLTEEQERQQEEKWKKRAKKRSRVHAATPTLYICIYN